MTWGLKKTAALIIGIYLLFCAGLLYWVVIYSGSGDGDTLEHVHSSWLVWSGKIPYKDFFQHHNPLLWYVGAPLVGFYEYSLRAVDAVNVLHNGRRLDAVLYLPPAPGFPVRSFWRAGSRGFLCLAAGKFI